MATSSPPSDTSYVEAWCAMGVKWIRLSQPKLWIEDGEVVGDRYRLLEVLRDCGVTFQITLSPSDSWQPVLELVEGNALAVGSWNHFVTTPDQILDEIKDSGAGILISVKRDEKKPRGKSSSPEKQLQELTLSTDRVMEYRIHVQPDRTSYGYSLAWIGDPKQRRDQYGNDPRDDWRSHETMVVLR